MGKFMLKKCVLRLLVHLTYSGTSTINQVCKKVMNYISLFLLQFCLPVLIVTSILFANYLPVLGKFCMLFCPLLIFYKVNIFNKFFQEYQQRVKQCGSRSGPKCYKVCLLAIGMKIKIFHCLTINAISYKNQFVCVCVCVGRGGGANILTVSFL